MAPINLWLVAGTDFWLSDRESTALFFWDAVAAHVKKQSVAYFAPKILKFKILVIQVSRLQQAPTVYCSIGLLV